LPDLIDTPDDVLISICVTKSMADKDSYHISINLIDKNIHIAWADDVPSDMNLK
jgi:hypothetical protein